MTQQPNTARRSRSVDSAIVAAFAAWVAFMIVAAGCALVVSLVTIDPYFGWSGDLALYSTFIAAIVSLGVVIVMIAPLAIIGRRVAITGRAWPLLVASAVGAASALLAVSLLLGDLDAFGTMRTDVILTMLIGYGLAGGIGGAVAWLVFDARTKRRASG